MARKRRQSRKHTGRKTRKIRGGSAWEYVQKMYGGLDEQTANVNNSPGQSNVIRPIGGTTMKGGRHCKKRGGNFLATAAVPAALFAASYYKSKSRKHQRGGSCGCSRKVGGGRAFALNPSPF